MGYAIRGTIQLDIEDELVSIERGKEAYFRVFDLSPAIAEYEGRNHNLPLDVYFAGKRVPWLEPTPKNQCHPFGQLV